MKRLDRHDIVPRLITIYDSKHNKIRMKIQLYKIINPHKMKNYAEVHPKDITPVSLKYVFESMDVPLELKKDVFDNKELFL